MDRLSQNDVSLLLDKLNFIRDESSPLTYLIWTSPRTGHTLLARMLADTKMAGNPGEHLTLHGESSLCEKYKVNDYPALKKAIWEAGSINGKIFATKKDHYLGDNELYVKEVRNLLDDEEFPITTIWNELLPNCKHIFLTRRNKVRQAVSWWKAIQDNTWHLPKGVKRSEKADFYKDKYDFNAISHLLHEAYLREASAQEYFSENNIIPLTLVYEDFIQNILETLLRIFEFLEIIPPSDFSVETAFEKTADDISECWVMRYKDELQQNWTNKAW